MLLEIFECRDLLLEMPVKVSDMGSVVYCAAEFIEEKTAFSRFSFCRSCAFHFQKERKAKRKESKKPTSAESRQKENVKRIIERRQKKIDKMNQRIREQRHQLQTSSKQRKTLLGENVINLKVQ